MSVNSETFFAIVRTKLDHSLSQDQVDGFNAILATWEGDDKRHLAYCLATAWHETATTMQPIEEYGKGHGHPYGNKGKYGQAPYGRGYVQLTWDANYEKADHELGLDGKLLKDFSLALDPTIAAQIMFEGMEHGWFTGKKLSNYFNDDTEDARNARRIINGTDCADKIAGYYKTFKEAVGA